MNQKNIPGGVIIQAGYKVEEVEFPPPLGKKQVHTIHALKIKFGTDSNQNQVVGASFGNGFTLKEAWENALKFLGDDKI